MLFARSGYTHVDDGRARLKMELNAKKTSSQALLSCGNGGGLDFFVLRVKKSVGRERKTRVISWDTASC